MSDRKSGHTKDIHSPEARKWEDFYRSRSRYDKKVRSTHGVNCTGSCTWDIFVKNGIVTNELQATDYPVINPELPGYEPRGCQRGAAFSWYLYSPLRVKHPYIRGTLLDLWEEAVRSHNDPVSAWASVMEDPEKRRSFQKERGMGGFRRTDWETVLEIAAASTLYTIKKYGPDRVIGFSPIPAMSYVSYASGARFLQLIGGSVLSFYDWYCDLPPASPEVWGEQTDVCESADWYNSSYIVVMGSNVNMTRTPDAHYIAEARYKGTKVVVLSPDYSQISKQADLWLPIIKGQDAAFWLAVDHVILKEFFEDKSTPNFVKYVKTYTDLPFLIKLEPTEDGGYKPGRYLRCSDTEEFSSVENAAWKMLLCDSVSGKLYPARGTAGYRWASEKGKWNLESADGISDEERDPVLTFEGSGQEAELVLDLFYDFPRTAKIRRRIPAKKISGASGEFLVATLYDVLKADLGVGAGEGYPASYDEEGAYTPAWQEKYTGIDRKTVVGVAREFAANAEKTGGKSMIIIGAGVNQWFNSDLAYRAAISALMLTGSVGVNGGGLAHYVGQEKVVPVSSWGAVAFGTDWGGPPRQQNTTSFWYFHSDQYRYEGEVFDYFPVPDKSVFRERHSADINAKAVRMGWLPFYPQFDRNPLEAAAELLAETSGDKEAASGLLASKLKKNMINFAAEDPDNEVNFPRVWYVWRGNSISSSAKGHEYFLKHVLGTENGVTAEEANYDFTDVKKRPAPEGKIDLIIDLNFRMDTSALYSDIVLPSATWYEKNDLNTTDLHSFVHPMTAAVPPLWESASDWEIFARLAKKVSAMAPVVFPGAVPDVVSVPLAHDTSDEIAESAPKDWKIGDDDPVPGKNMPKIVFVERDYSKIYEKYVALGPKISSDRIGAHGVSWSSAEEYEELKAVNGTVRADGLVLPDISTDVKACEAILRLAPETNGRVSVKAYKDLEEKTGRSLSHLASGFAQELITFDNIVAQPRRILNSPCWSGLVDNGRAYAPFVLNVEHLVPWRTVTGRQQFYMDHEAFIASGENLIVYKPEIPAVLTGEGADSGNYLRLNMLTPHGKWQIHSTYFDNERMTTLSRGGQTLWMSPQDALSINAADNDWLEIINENGAAVCRAVISVRIPKGVCVMYHAPERTFNVPISPTLNKRAGVHNSLSRIRMKPTLTAGGYGQFTYAFNYWGTVGVNRETYVSIRKLSEVRF